MKRVVAFIIICIIILGVIPISNIQNKNERGRPSIQVSPIQITKTKTPQIHESSIARTEGNVKIRINKHEESSTSGNLYGGNTELQGLESNSFPYQIKQTFATMNFQAWNLTSNMKIHINLDVKGYILNLESSVQLQAHISPIHVIDIDENTHDHVIASKAFTIYSNNDTEKNPPEIVSYEPSDNTAVTGEITFRAVVKDDYGIKNVIISFNNESEFLMHEISGHIKEGIFEYKWDSRKVIDGTYKVCIRASDIDSSKISTVCFTIITKNKKATIAPPDLVETLYLPSNTFFVLILVAFVTLNKLREKQKQKQRSGNKGTEILFR